MKMKPLFPCLCAAGLILLFLGGCGLPANTPKPTPALTGCDLAKLSASATWQPDISPLTGSLTLTNFESAACTLSGQLDLLLVDESQIPLEITSQPRSANPPPEINLAPEASAAIEFAWSNWCGRAPVGSFNFILQVENSPGPRLIPITDPNGQPLSGTPLCEDAQKASLISLGDLQLLP